MDSSEQWKEKECTLLTKYISHVTRRHQEDISISGILQFRHSLSFIEGRYMFSIAWGDVSYRDRMVVSTQEVYRRLLLQSPDESVLKFEVLAMAALKSNGSLDEQKLQALIHLLRPDRDGRLFVIVFVVRNLCLQPGKQELTVTLYWQAILPCLTSSKAWTRSTRRRNCYGHR